MNDIEVANDPTQAEPKRTQQNLLPSTAWTAAQTQGASEQDSETVEEIEQDVREAWTSLVEDGAFTDDRAIAVLRSIRLVVILDRAPTKSDLRQKDIAALFGGIEERFLQGAELIDDEKASCPDTDQRWAFFVRLNNPKPRTPSITLALTELTGAPSAGSFRVQNSANDSPLEEQGNLAVGFEQANVDLLKTDQSRYSRLVADQVSNQTTQQSSTSQVRGIADFAQPDHVGAERDQSAEDAYLRFAASPTARALANLFRIKSETPLSDEDEETFVGYLDPSGDPRVIEAAALGVWETGIPAARALPALKPLIAHADTSVSAAAIQEIGRYGGADELVREFVDIGRRHRHSRLIVGRLVDALADLRELDSGAVEFLAEVALPTKRTRQDERWERIRRRAERTVKALTEPPQVLRTLLDYVPAIVKLRAVTPNTAQTEVQEILNETSKYFQQHPLSDLSLNRQLCGEINKAVRSVDARVACCRCHEKGPSTLCCQPGGGIESGQFQFQHRKLEGKGSIKHGGTEALPNLKLVAAGVDRRRTRSASTTQKPKKE